MTEAKKEDINRVCFCEALYPFTFYLLISTIEEIRHTAFFVDRRISPKIREKLPYTVVTDIDSHIRMWMAPVFGWYMRLKCLHKYPFLYKSEIFGLDFKWEYLQGLKLHYIEDGPNSFNLWETGPMFKRYVGYTQKSKFEKALIRLFRGNFYRQPIATSSSIIDIYTTAAYDKSYHKGKPQYILNWQELWENSSEEKKHAILGIFDITTQDLELLQQKNTILLTQAFYDDKMMTKDEQIEMYRNIINNYDTNDLVIKPHPRDFINYKELFPNVYVFDKVVPMQILTVLGVSFTNIATVTSSAALAFGVDKKIDWYGSYTHPGIIKNEGLRTLEAAIEQYKKQNNIS